MLGACGLFARAWIELSGAGPMEVYNKLQKQFHNMTGGKDEDLNLKNYASANVVLKSPRAKTDGGKPLLAKLKEVIPTAALVGGMCIAILSITADLFGAI
jgi:protein transport protein SEC61 subunit alpha